MTHQATYQKKKKKRLINSSKQNTVDGLVNTILWVGGDSPTSLEENFVLNRMHEATNKKGEGCN